MTVRIREVFVNPNPLGRAIATATVELDGITVWGVRIVRGHHGIFASGPARRDEGGRWWPFAAFDDATSEAIVVAATAALRDRGIEVPE